MKIAINTKGRPNRQYTLKNIYKSFKKDEIFLFVEPQDIDSYKKYEKIATIVDIGENDKGLRFSRQKAFDTLDGTFFILDDDLTDFRKRTGRTANGYWKMEKMSSDEIKVMFLYIENFLKKNQEYGQASISFTPSNWLWEGDHKENTRAWSFKGYNSKLLKERNIQYGIGIDLFEDYDHTLSILKAGLKNISFYSWSFSAVKLGEGAGGIDRDKEKVVKSVKLMSKKWGSEIVKEFYSKAHNYPEIKVNWKKAYETFNTQTS